MFAVYWPVMAFVAAIVLALAFLSLSLGKMCGARTEPLPERDLTTYLPEDVSIKTSSISNKLKFPNRVVTSFFTPAIKEVTFQNRYWLLPSARHLEN